MEVNENVQIELNAITAIAKAIASLSPEARARVMAWANDFVENMEE